MNGQERIIAVSNYLEQMHPLAVTARQIAVMTLMSEAQVRVALKEMCPAPVRIKKGVGVAFMSSGLPLRMVGTHQEPRPAKPGNRYCYACDEFLNARVCKACGLETEKAN